MDQPLIPPKINSGNVEDVNNDSLHRRYSAKFVQPENDGSEYDENFDIDDTDEYSGIPTMGSIMNVQPHQNNIKQLNQ